MTLRGSHSTIAATVAAIAIAAFLTAVAAYVLGLI